MTITAPATAAAKAAIPEMPRPKKCRRVCGIPPCASLAPPGGAAGEEEQTCRQLWRRFYEAVSIEARENPKCRMTHMPKRFWADLTELNGEDEQPGLTRQ